MKEREVCVSTPNSDSYLVGFTTGELLDIAHTVEDGIDELPTGSLAGIRLAALSDQLRHAIETTDRAQAQGK